MLAFLLNATQVEEDVVNAFSIVFMILMVLFSIAMIIIVALQEGNNNNLGAVSGSSESFFGKNRAKTLDTKLKRLTAFVGVGIMLSSIIYFILYLVRNSFDKFS